MYIEIEKNKDFDYLRKITIDYDSTEPLAESKEFKDLQAAIDAMIAKIRQRDLKHTRSMIYQSGNPKLSEGAIDWYPKDQRR